MYAPLPFVYTTPLTSSPSAAFLLQVPSADFTIAGEYTEWWTTGDSGGKVGRFFCGVCGRQVETRGLC